MALPEPVLPKHDIVKVQSISYESASLIWYTWSQDPTKAAVLRAILSCQDRLRERYFDFRRIIAIALGQHVVCFLHCVSLEVEEVHY